MCEGLPTLRSLITMVHADIFLPDNNNLCRSEGKCVSCDSSDVRPRLEIAQYHITVRSFTARGLSILSGCRKYEGFFRSNMAFKLEWQGTQKKSFCCAHGQLQEQCQLKFVHAGQKPRPPQWARPSPCSTTRTFVSERFSVMIHSGTRGCFFLVSLQHIFDVGFACGPGPSQIAIFCSNFQSTSAHSRNPDWS